MRIELILEPWQGSRLPLHQTRMEWSGWGELNTRLRTPKVRRLAAGLHPVCFQRTTVTLDSLKLAPIVDCLAVHFDGE